MARFPPGPPGLVALRRMFGGGNVGRAPAFFRDVAARYGPIASWRMGPPRFYLVSEPALIEELLVARGRSFVKGRGTQRLERLLGRGLLTSNGALHLSQRRLVQPAFHRERIAGYAATMVEHAERFADALPLDRPVAIERAMHRLTLAIAAETLFGTQLEADAGTIGRALDAAMTSFPLAVLPFGELLDLLPMLPVTRRFQAARAQLDAIVYRIIAERRAGPATSSHDLLSLLLAAGEDGVAMDDRQVRDEALTLLLAGHETTANALTWCWWLLARHPEVQARVHAELDAVLAGRRPTFDDLPALKRTHDVVAEALRLYPPAWVVGRRAIEPVELGGWRLARGSLVVTSQYAVQRDPRWWTAPEAFRPERWSNGETAALPKFAYFPFGGGTRLCIGEGFAWAEAILVLAAVARRFRFEPADEREPGLAVSVTLRPAGSIPLRAVPR
jgi:cytochrome P450